MDVTINWKDLKAENDGIFYTDANSLKMIPRNIHGNNASGVSVPQFSSYTVPSYFYPVNSGIYLEDHLRDVQMVVMNDRP
jgi:hypothetical protein